MVTTADCSSSVAALDDECISFVSFSEQFLLGSQTLLCALWHIHKGLVEENQRLPHCRPSTRKRVNSCHQDALKNVIKLLKAYGLNLLELHNSSQTLAKERKKCSSRRYAKAEEARQKLLLQRDQVLHAVEAIVKCQLKYMSEQFVSGSSSLESEDVFKVIRTFNLVLENLKRNLIIDEEEVTEEVKVEDQNIPSTSSLIVPTVKKKQPDPPPPPVEKLKVVIVPETMTSPTATLKKFTASRILQTVGVARTGQVTEFIAEALLSRVDVPADNGSSARIHYPWKPVTFGIGSSSLPNMDIFEEALAKEEDENTLNQRKLDMALRLEFGEDFPGTDYLPAECSEALRPLSSPRMDALIKTNTAFLELLLKKFLNTPGVMVPSLVKYGRYGELRLSKAGRTRLEGYYVDQIWGVGANLVDELLLWSPLILSRDVAPRDPEHGVTSAPGIAGRQRGSSSNRTGQASSSSRLECGGSAEPGSTLATPTSDRSTTSSTGSDATIINTSHLGGGKEHATAKAVVVSKGPRLVTLNVDDSQSASPGMVYGNFLAPVALEIPHLLYLQEAFNKYIRRGVLPGWCAESCEAVAAECGHLATQTNLDRHLVLGIGAYARRKPPPVRLPDGNYSTNGGIGFSGAMELLVWQVNQIEKTEAEEEEKDWPIADLVEHLSVLCSCCSSALCWLQLRSECLLNTWTTAPYYLLTQADLPHLLAHLAKIKIEEREYLAKTDELQRAVLVPYRERLVARTEALLVAVKRQEALAVEALNGVCRTVGLAYLQNAMPPPAVWRGVGRLPHEPHRYVGDYIGCVLQPVLDAVSQLGDALQRRAGSAVLKVVCYAWLEHITAQNIKFSLWGAQQLLKDFAALSDWVRGYPGLSPGAREQVLAVDVLRECEGVARLLMRQPPLVVGYSSLNQVAPLTSIKAGREHDKTVSLGKHDDIPAEMYVPNQAAWLNRRARPASSACVKAASCCSWPY